MSIESLASQMANIDDSGIDSDQKSQQNEGLQASSKSGSYTALKKTSELQKKIERQRDQARRSGSVTLDQQPKKSNFLSRSRLTVPSGNGKVRLKDTDSFSPDQQQPLVAIVSDESEEDEFDVLRIPKAAQKEIKEQLIKDGYNLDLEPDDEDLDLIPPRPLNERWSCCNVHIGCRIQ